MDLKFNLNPTEQQLQTVFTTFFFRMKWLPNDSFLNQFMPRDLYERRLTVRWITIQDGDDTVFAFPVPAKADGTIVLATDKVVKPFISGEQGCLIIFLMLWINFPKFKKKSKYHDDVMRLMIATDSFNALSAFATGSIIED